MQLHIASKNWFRNLMCSHLAYENTQFWISTNYFMSNQMKLILAFDFFRAHEVQCYLVLHIGMVQGELPTIDTVEKSRRPMSRPGQEELSLSK